MLRPLSCRHGAHTLALSWAETLLQGWGGPRFTGEETEAEVPHVAQALQAGEKQAWAPSNVERFGRVFLSFIIAGLIMLRA